MPYYKYPENKLHFLDDVAFEHLLPAGSVQITDEEAEAIRAADMPVVAPVYSCSPWQIRKALNALGLRDAVEAAITEGNDRTLKDGWEFATEFRSDDPFVLAMGASLGKDAAGTAELIKYASTL